MCSVCRALAALAIAAAVVSQPLTVSSGPPPLRVCADPNNMPFSNARGEGFENAIAQVLGRALGRPVRYFWQPQRRAFFRTTLQAGNCDVVVNVPASFERVRATRPYYRSAYVFVTQQARHLDIRSFDDPRLRPLRIGIQITGDDYDNPPAAQALASRQLVDNLRGYTVYGDYSKDDPQRAIVDAVAGGAVDVAIVWGPLAGYFAARAATPLSLTPVEAQLGRDRSFAFDMAVGVRRDDAQLHDKLDAAVVRRFDEIQTILRRFNVPLVGPVHNRRVATGGTP